MDDLPEWSFSVDEVSAGVYRAAGLDLAGRSVQTTSTDPEAALQDAGRWR
jgi:hypothetical protein